MHDTKRLLLLSSSRVHGGEYFAYAETEVREFLTGVDEILFVPFALHDHDAYFETVRHQLMRFGYAVASLHSAQHPAEAVRAAQAIFVGGGNTFRLLATLYELKLLDLIRERVRGGMPYLGSSAGSNIAAPTIKTTNDMPIVQPASFAALGLVPFQINPHYVDSDPGSTHMGESREERLLQYLEENDAPVIGLREGAMLRVENGQTTLLGISGARIYRKGETPIEVGPGTRLDDLLSEPSDRATGPRL